QVLVLLEVWVAAVNARIHDGPNNPFAESRERIARRVGFHRADRAIGKALDGEVGPDVINSAVRRRCGWSGPAGMRGADRPPWRAGRLLSALTFSVTSYQLLQHVAVQFGKKVLLAELALVLVDSLRTIVSAQVPNNSVHQMLDALTRYLSPFVEFKVYVDDDVVKDRRRGWTLGTHFRFCSQLFEQRNGDDRLVHDFRGKRLPPRIAFGRGRGRRTRGGGRVGDRRGPPWRGLRLRLGHLFLSWTRLS